MTSEIWDMCWERIQAQVTFVVMEDTSYTGW